MSRAADHAARRRFGVFDTPPLLAAMVLRVAREALGHSPTSILDPAAGVGVFLSEAKLLWPEAKLAGFELNDARARQVIACGAELLGKDFLSAPPQPRYDLVVGNPPWVSYSGRQAQAPFRNLPPMTGWRSLHSILLMRASEWVVPRGVMAMLAPATLAYQAGYAHLRAHLTSHGRLEWLTDIPQNSFAGVTMPYAVLLWKEGAVQSARPSHSRPLPPPAPIFHDPGVHTGNAADILLHNEPSPHRVPIRVGRDVRPFCLARPSLWLEPRPTLPDGRYARVGKPERYFSVPILLRQTASRPVAGVHWPRAHFRNSVLACSGLADHEHEFVTAVLNSRAVAVLYRLINPDARQRAFPQIKVGGLARLPLARCEPGEADIEEPIRLAEQWLGRPLARGTTRESSGTAKALWYTPSPFSTP